MGYFEGLNNGQFKKDKNGNTIFFPWGVLGRGRILPDDQAEIRVRVFVGRHSKVVFTTMLGVDIIGGALLFLLLAPIFVVWFYFGIKSLVSSYPYSEDKLSLK